MPKQNAQLVAFNRGIVSPLALARVDIEQILLSAEQQNNWMPRVLGSMMLRPGTQYIDTVGSNPDLFDFVFSKDDTAIIAFIRGVSPYAKIYVDDSQLTFNDVSTTISSGSWVDNDDAGATSNSVATTFVGTGFAYARRYQELTIAAGDQNVKHALELEVVQGYILLKIGSSVGGQQFFDETLLGAGVHVIQFTPTGASAYIELASNTKYTTQVINKRIMGSSDNFFEPFPWSGVSASGIRWVQSADIMYFANSSFPPMKIERRDNNSWSAVRFEPEDGPFLPYNTSGITITPSDISGDITLTASADLFRSNSVYFDSHEQQPSSDGFLGSGALFMIDSVGQKVESDISGEDQWTNEIRVAGLERSFLVTIASIGSNTVTLQRSIGAPGSWSDVTPQYTSNGTTAYNDALDNQIIYYRIGIKTGDYSSGTTTVTLEYSQGSISGICRITDVASATSASAIVLREFGGTQATTRWREGAWSEYRGWPSAVALYEGRLWWAGKQSIWASESDNYESYDPGLEGDSRPISRSIGFGSADSINWMDGAQRLIFGTDTRIISARSSSQDEPLTQDNFSLKDCSTQGSDSVMNAKLDSSLLYVHSSQTRLISLSYDSSLYDYRANDLSLIAPEVGQPAVTKIAVQRQPDTRIHCMRSDGKVAILVFDDIEQVQCWVEYETDGSVSDILIFPGDDEDVVYYLINRTTGNTGYFLEKWAKESECQGGTTNKQADSFITYSGSSTTTITGLDHLDDKSVVVWGDGKFNGTYTVSSGSITLSTAVSEAVIGLGYTATFESSKLAYAAALGSALTQLKRISQVGLVMRNTHATGIKYGPDSSNLDDIPKDDLPLASGVPDEDHVFSDYDQVMFSFDGIWNTDPRLYLQAQAPKPCTVLASVFQITTNDKG